MRNFKLKILSKTLKDLDHFSDTEEFEDHFKYNYKVAINKDPIYRGVVFLPLVFLILLVGAIIVTLFADSIIQLVGGTIAIVWFLVLGYVTNEAIKKIEKEMEESLEDRDYIKALILETLRGTNMYFYKELQEEYTLDTLDEIKVWLRHYLSKSSKVS